MQAGKQLWCSGLGPPNTRRHNIWIIPRDSPGTRGSPPMLLSNSQLQTYSLSLREKKGGEGGRRGHGLRFFCGLSNIALNYVLTGRCQEQLCQRGGAIVGHHCGECIFGKMNFLHLHSERKRNLALFLYLVQDHHLYKPNVTQDI